MENRHVFRRRSAVLGLLMSSMFVSYHAIEASEIEKWLIMPGPVAAVHAETETECDACHAPLSEVRQAELCVACHTAVGDDISSGSGFHGRMSEQDQTECAACHAEHEGRDALIVDLDKTTFDHNLTDFILRGAHTDAACRTCHADGELRRDAPTECVACHKQDDVHRGQLGETCSNCHTEERWASAEFDHTTTGFALSGGHAGIECGACHQSPHLADVGRTCVACHAADDVHQGRNGTDCASCHTTANWTDSSFDHHAVSGLALLGGHEGLSCGSCHEAADFRDLGSSTCQTCHASDDAHDGRFGTDCGSCHNNFDWRSVFFDHAARTGFALPDGHRNLECAACHTDNIHTRLPRSCSGCHAPDDVHRGQLGQECERCHVPSTWTAQLWFDHDLTSFPLIGAHAQLVCASCHESAAFHDAGHDCISCHREDDLHRGGLGPQCDDCHNPASWQAWLFDHDAQTGFALNGAHAEVSCDGCHTERTSRMASTPSDCNSCHRRDDPHLGRFGNNCETCHGTSSFSQLEGL